MKISDSHTNSARDSSELSYRETMYRLFNEANAKSSLKSFHKKSHTVPVKVKKSIPPPIKPKNRPSSVAVPVAAAPSVFPVKVTTAPKVKKEDFLADDYKPATHRPPRGYIKGFFVRYRRGVLFVCFATLSLVFIVSSLIIFKSVLKRDTPKVAGTSYIAPKTVFLPKDLPDGFSIGSSNQELENGAIIYTVFGPGGEEITITQQMSSPNLDQKMLEGGFKFTTPHGTAYVLDNTERLTGYLLAEDSWVLLNNFDGLKPEDMRTLIRALEPI